MDKDFEKSMQLLRSSEDKEIKNIRDVVDGANMIVNSILKGKKIDISFFKLYANNVQNVMFGKSEAPIQKKNLRRKKK